MSLDKDNIKNPIAVIYVTHETMNKHQPLPKHVKARAFYTMRSYYQSADAFIKDFRLRMEQSGLPRRGNWLVKNRGYYDDNIRGGLVVSIDFFSDYAFLMAKMLYNIND